MSKFVFVLLVLSFNIANADEVIFFSSVSCGPCKTQEASIVDLIKSGSVRKISIDGPDGRKLFDNSGFRYIPQIAKFDKDGKLIKALQPGPRPREEVLELIDIDTPKKRDRILFWKGKR